MYGCRCLIYEFEEGGQSVIGAWLDAKGVSPRDRGQLVAKMDMLALHGPDLPSGVLSDSPIKSKRNPKMQSHVYKLKVRGEKMLRPFLCKGPFDMDGEFTFLLGAIEKDSKLDEDVEDAEIRRTILIQDPSRRIRNGRYRRDAA
jgi:hypothetical protein